MNTYFVAKYNIEGIENASVEECAKFLSTLSEIGIDIETSVNEEYRHLQNNIYKGGLDPYLSRVVMLQLGNVETNYVIDTRDFSKEELMPILKLLHYKKNVVLVGHNLKFEQLHLRHTYGIRFANIWDTLLCEITLYNGIPIKLGLADLAYRYLNIKKKKELSLFEEKNSEKVVTLDEDLLNEIDHAITPFDIEDDFQIDKSTRMQFINIGDKPFTYQQVMYGRDDIVFPILIRQKQRVGRVIEGTNVIHKPEVWQRVENAYCLVLADIELKGMYVDSERWNTLHDKNYEIYKQRELALTKFVVANYPQFSAGTLDMFTNEKTCVIQWTSSSQVIKFYKSLGICPRAYSKQTKQVEYTVGATELTRTLPNALKVLYEKNKDVEIVDLDTFTLGYLLFKKSEQAVTTFGKSWLKYIHPLTGRAHSKYKQVLNTTRISSSNPNLNNISGGEWRECFRVPEGKIMVNLDYSTQELKVLSSKSGDETLISFFTKGDPYFGEDFHSFSATNMYKALENNPDLIVPPKEIRNKEGVMEKNPLYTKDDDVRRGNSKQLTFGLAFGKSVFTFAADLGLTEQETTELLDVYFDAFPGLRDHFDRCTKAANENSYIIIDAYTGACWFCPFFNEMQKMFKQAWTFFPEGYSQLRVGEKAAAKKLVYEKHPEAKRLFQQGGRLKNGLINKNKNYPIQGTCAQMMKIAMCMARIKIIEQRLPYDIIGNIYDEALVEVPSDQGDKAGEMMKQCMEAGGGYLDKVVPQRADYVLSEYWGH